MLRTVEAIVEKDGNLRLLEDVELRAGERALVTILGEEALPHETAFLSQAALAEDWEGQEEDEAWAHPNQRPADPYQSQTTYSAMTHGHDPRV